MFWLADLLKMKKLRDGFEAEGLINLVHYEDAADVTIKALVNGDIICDNYFSRSMIYIMFHFMFDRYSGYHLHGKRWTSHITQRNH